MPRVKAYKESTYNGYSLNTNHGFLRENILQGIKELLDYNNLVHNRTALAHLTLNTDEHYMTRIGLIDNSPIKYFTKRFMEYLRSLSLTHNLNPLFIWKLEICPTTSKPHWHLILTWNYDAIISLGNKHLEV